MLTPKKATTVEVHRDGQQRDGREIDEEHCEIGHVGHLSLRFE
jgi:hypothetical protein